MQTTARWWTLVTLYTQLNIVAYRTQNNDGVLKLQKNLW
jgi:hypothetical protein